MDSYNAENFLSDLDKGAEEYVMLMSKRDALLKNLRETKVRLSKSNIHGVGVFAMEDIKKGERVFTFNGNPKFGSILELPWESLDNLPQHVKDMIKSFFLPTEKEDGKLYYPIPEVGIVGGLGIDKFLNSSQKSGSNNIEIDGNVSFGEEIDESGFLEVIAEKNITAGEELLGSYQIQDCGRCVASKDRENMSSKNICRICQDDDDLTVVSTANVVDIGCMCKSPISIVHSHCAKKWFYQKVCILFSPEDLSAKKASWIPSIKVECDICKTEISETIKMELVDQLYNDSNKAMNFVAKCIQETDTMRFLKNSRGPTFLSKKQKNIRSRKGGLGKRTSNVVTRRASKKTPGFLSNKNAKFYMADDKKWINGKIHEYIPAKVRNNLRGCTEQHERGLYRYTFKYEDGEDVEDYFSDDDRTVKVNGKTGIDLWG
jgi:hypothetical protein